jgi:NAD(P)-dependent dehydrogenase (short-subunit alcohol dehydrogenase family)
MKWTVLSYSPTLGEAIAHLFAANGWSFLLWDRREDIVERAALNDRRRTTQMVAAREGGTASLIGSLFLLPREVAHARDVRAPAERFVAMSVP